MQPLQNHMPFNSFLAYVQRFEIIPQTIGATGGNLQINPVTQMYMLRRSTRADGTPMGDVIPLSQLRAPADLIPRFHKNADTRFTKETSLAYSTEFFLNKFFDKNMYYSLEN